MQLSPNAVSLLAGAGVLTALGCRAGLHHRPFSAARDAVTSLGNLLKKPFQHDPVPDAADLWLIVGLGNPGTKYAKTRHNVGFMLVDHLAQQNSIAVDRVQHKAACGRGVLWGCKVLLVKPQTYMNDSGQAVGRLAQYYKVPVERVLVIMDDLDLPTAKLRLRGKGSHGGHNGMRSIIAHLHSSDFPRLKIGIGHPTGSKKVVDWVLTEFLPSDQQDMESALAEGISTVRAVLTLGTEKALSGMRR